MVSPRALLLTFGLMPLVLTGPAPSAKGSLTGAWKIAHAAYSGPDTSWVLTDPQASLVIFTEHHYSMMYVPGQTPRALFRESTPTDAEKIAAYDSFIANSGTYVVTDSTLTTRPIVAKNPSFTGLSFVFRLWGDSLWLTFRSPSSVAGQGLRTTLVRLK